jgi:hypothetical protein
MPRAGGEVTRGVGFSRGRPTRVFDSHAEYDRIDAETV